MCNTPLVKDHQQKTAQVFELGRGMYAGQNHLAMSTNPHYGVKGHIDNPNKDGKHRKHTPITSEKQRGMFGAELARREAGKKPKMKGITTKELKDHLKESKGKNLPKEA